MRSSKLMLIVASVVFALILLSMLITPSARLSPAGGWWPWPMPWWPSQPVYRERLGPGGIQTGANLYLPAHPMPWLGPHGGTQTGANVRPASTGVDPAPWMGPHGGIQTGGTIGLPAHSL